MKELTVANLMGLIIISVLIFGIAIVAFAIELVRGRKRPVWELFVLPFCLELTQILAQNHETNDPFDYPQVTRMNLDFILVTLLVTLNHCSLFLLLPLLLQLLPLATILTLLVSTR